MKLAKWTNVIFSLCEEVRKISHCPQKNLSLPYLYLVVVRRVILSSPISNFDAARNGVCRPIRAETERGDCRSHFDTLFGFFFLTLDWRCNQAKSAS